MGSPAASPAKTPSATGTKRVAKRTPSSKATKRTKVSHDGMGSDDDDDHNESPLAKKSIKVEDEDTKLNVKDEVEEIDEI